MAEASSAQSASQGELHELLERCAVELWVTEHLVERCDGPLVWDELGWADRRDYRLMAAAVLKEAGVDGIPTMTEIRAAAHDGDEAF